MKFLIQVLTIIILSFLLELFLPWWSIAIAAFIGGLIFDTKANFGAGFLAIAMLWLVSIVLMDVSASAPLSDRVAAIFMINRPLLYIVTAVIGGLVGGFACMAGGAVLKRTISSYY